jgi:hypothetical protein
MFSDYFITEFAEAHGCRELMKWDGAETISICAIGDPYVEEVEELLARGIELEQTVRVLRAMVSEERE